MRGIPVLEKYRYLLYFKRYDIIILHNSVYAAVAKCTCRWQCSQIAAQPVKCDNRTTDGSNRLNSINASEINKQRTVEVKYGITLDTKQMIKLKELTLLHLYASVAIGINYVATGTHQIFLSICRLLILIFSEN